MNCSTNQDFDLSPDRAPDAKLDHLLSPSEPPDQYWNAKDDLSVIKHLRSRLEPHHELVRLVAPFPKP